MIFAATAKGGNKMAHCSDCLHYEVCEAYMMTVSFEVDDGLCRLFDRRDEWSKIVRCEDCIHQRERNEEEKVYLIDGVLICTSPDATDSCWNPVFPNHFCSYGERRCDRCLKF